MGLDQSIYHAKPNVLDPHDYGEEIAYWRKDWALQDYINTDNCEKLPLTIDICDNILSNLSIIYENESNDSYLDYTNTSFLKAKALLEQGERVIYYANW